MTVDDAVYVGEALVDFAVDEAFLIPFLGARVDGRAVFYVVFDQV